MEEKKDSTGATILTSSKRTPQVYRQCWKILRARIEAGRPFPWAWTKGSLMAMMDAIEKQVKG